MKDFSLALAVLRELANSDDTETAHYDADDILCEILTALGYTEIVDAYNAIDKWYS